jgi:SAM-dependent methyltransferase
MRPVDGATEHTLAFVQPYLGPGRARVLEVGCGGGEFARRLLDLGHDVVALDEDEEAVRRARALGVPARQVAWPNFADEPFDAILFTRSLHHINPLGASVARARQLLRPGGKVIVEDFACTELGAAAAAWFDGVLALLDVAGKLTPAGEQLYREVQEAGGSGTAWPHFHDLHPAPAMAAALREHFGEVVQTPAAYLYRYVCRAVSDDDAGHVIAASVLSWEERLAANGAITLFGRRFVATA